MFDRKTYQKNRYEERKKWLIEMLGGKCNKCNSCNSLEIDHKDPKIKSFNILCMARGMVLEKLVVELKKCQLLCSACHKNKTKIDGSTLYGETCASSKLSLNDVKKIRCDIRSSRAVAKEFGVSHVSILNIKNNKSWRRAE